MGPGHTQDERWNIKSFSKGNYMYFFGQDFATGIHMGSSRN